MPITEKTPQNPEHPYGTTKLAAERMIRDYAGAHGIGFALLRYFNAAGADLDGHHGESRRHETHLIPIILSVATGRRPKLSIFGNDWPTRDGTCVRDYIHTADLADAHEQAVQAIGPGIGKVYNLGSGTGATVLEVLKAAEEVVGRPIPHEYAPRRPGDPPSLYAQPGLIAEELGWRPQYSEIETIVGSAWRWHQQNPDGYA